EYYISKLRPEEVTIIQKAESEKSLLELMNGWLERMPLAPSFNKEEKESFWSDYRNRYQNSLADVEKDNLTAFDEIFFETDTPETQISNTHRSLSAKACRAALFIMLYRGYPLLQQPFQLLNA